MKINFVCENVFHSIFVSVGGTYNSVEVDDTNLFIYTFNLFGRDSVYMYRGALLAKCSVNTPDLAKMLISIRSPHTVSKHYFKRTQRVQNT